MEIAEMLLVSVSDLLMVAMFVAAFAVILSFSMFAVELADSLMSPWLRGLLGTRLTRKQCEVRAWKSD